MLGNGAGIYDALRQQIKPCKCKTDKAWARSVRLRMCERIGSDRMQDGCNSVVTPNIKNAAGTWSAGTRKERAAGKAVSLASFPILLIPPAHKVVSPETTIEPE